jgi:hypothetical protein
MQPLSFCQILIQFINESTHSAAKVRMNPTVSFERIHMLALHNMKTGSIRNARSVAVVNEACWNAKKRSSALGVQLLYSCLYT